MKKDRDEEILISKEDAIKFVLSIKEPLTFTGESIPFDELKSNNNNNNLKTSNMKKEETQVKLSSLKLEVKKVNPEVESDNFYGHIGVFAMNPEVLKEYDGYPLVTKKGWSWGMVLNKTSECIGFYAHSMNTTADVATLETIYVKKEFRGQGVFNLMYNDFLKNLPETTLKVKVLSTLVGKPIYKKKRFVTTKAFKKWFQMEKNIKK